MVNVLTLLKRTEEKVSFRYLVGPYCYFLRYDALCLPVRFAVKF